MLRINNSAIICGLRKLMGNFLKTIERAHQVKIDQFFTSHSLTKLRQFYGLFKSISQTYSIDNEQFCQLFGKHQEIFQLFDTDNNLLIDGLELFSGLILLSTNLKYEDKIVFLFQLFDFNDLKSLSKTDIEFMLISACSAVSKTYLLKNLQDDGFIQEFVRDQFPSDQRVNISQMLKWTRNCTVVSQFFQSVHQKWQKEQQGLLEQKIYITLHQPKQQMIVPSMHHYLKQQQFMLQTQKIFKLTQEQNEIDVKNSDINPFPSWVYGIRHKDVKQFLKYIVLQSQQLLLYFISKIAVIYNIKSKNQTHYLGHRHQIISLTVKQDLCATGEYASDPQVRIWNIKTLATVQVIKGYHIRGVHLIQFLSNGLLVTCGSSQESPIIMFEIDSGLPVFSTYSNFPAVEISPLKNFTNRKSEQFIVSSLYQIYHFQCSQTQGKLSMSISKFYSSIKQSKITTCCFFMINSTFRHLSQYDEKVEKQILTGHENGLVNLWNLHRREKEQTFSQEGSEIVRLIPTHTHLLVVTDSSFLTYYSIDVQDRVKLKTIDITQTELHLQSYDVSEVNLHNKQKKMIIFTKKADIFVFYEQQSSDAPTLSHFTNIRYKTKRVEHILSLEGKIRQQKVIKKDGNNSLYFTISHSIKAIDVINHRYLREWNIGQEIICFDVTHTKTYGLFIVAATTQNKLYIFSNKAESPNKANVDGEIVSVHIHTEDSPPMIIVLVSTKEGIIKYNVIKNILSNPNFIARPNLSPQLTPLQGNVIALSDQNNQLSALIIKQMHIQKLSACTSSQPLKIFYHIPLANKKLILPVIVGNRTKAQIAGRQDGKIFIWNSYEELSNHNFVVLDAHISSVADIGFSHDQKFLFTCGKNDGMIVSWRMRYYNEQGSAVIGKLKDQQIYDGLTDDFSGRRVEFCKFRNDKLVRNYDQYINVKGIKNDVIRRLFKSNLNDWRINNKVVRNQEPHLHLKMSFVFGIETYNQNNTVIALKSPKRFLYFVSKIIVMYYPAENDQQFYRGHRFKVTSMVLLEDGVRVASAQASFRPSIHIWSTKTLETERIIHTYHRWGIIQLVTHRNIILSYGLKEVKYEQQSNALNQDGGYERTLYSYQVTDYEKGLVIATREQKNVIHCMAINPLSHLSFASCSEGKVTFWQVSFHSIIKKKVCWLRDDTPTCCIYFSPKIGEPDLLVGTISGAVGIITRRQNWNIFKKGEKESKRINCILLIRRVDETLIMVASEDNLIKIYNQKLQQKFKESMLKIQPIQQGSKKVRESKGDRQDRNCSVQSLSLINDPYGKSNDNREKQELRILLGTRNGEVLELVQSKQGRYGSSKSLFFKAILYLRFNSSQDIKRVRNKVLITHHPKQQIIATIGLDQQIIFWDTEHNKLLHVTEMNIQSSEKKYPTAIKFSHNGDYLIVGFSDGQLMFLESKMAKSIQSKTDEKYCPLNLGKAKKEKDEDGQAVLNIQISQNGEYIAVSYQKIDSQKSYSHIKISHFKIKEKTKNSKSEYDKILDNTSQLPCPHLQRSFHTQSGLLFGFAAYSLSFAAIQNTSKQYFLSYYQMIDENQSRLSINIEKGEERNYNIWQVSDSIYPVTSPLVQTIKWKKFYIHNAIQTNYIFHQTDLSLTPKQQSPPSNNNLDLLQFTNMTIFDQCIITTSFNGDLHIFKLGTLEGEGQGMIGKTIPGHCCKINQIQLFYNQFKSNIYTSGENDQCIIKWSVEKFDSLMDNENYQEDQKDLFGEVPDKFELDSRVKLYKSKCEVERVHMRNQDFIQWFRVKHIFGRKAEQGRNNLKYDKYQRIIYSSGHSIVTYDPPTGSREFIYIKNDPSHYIQEITALEISKDGQFLVSCHSGLKAGVVLWQLNSKILLKRFYLKEIIHILYVSLSEDNQRLIIYGITADSIGQLMMIDLFNEEIMAVVTYTHKQAWQIKSICFRTSSHDKFVTCGIESIKQWQLISNQLINVSSIEQDENIISTCVDFIHGNVVIANDRGELMIWTQSGEVVRREEHQNMIACLSVSEENIIVTGSISTEENLAQVIIWAFQSNELIVIDKISIRNDPNSSLIVSSKLESRKYKESDVQSLHISRSRNGICKALIGVTKGDIYEYSFDPTIKNEKSQIKSSGIKENQPMLISSFDDGQRIRSMFFTSNESQLFQISQNGLLRVWKIQKAQLQWSHAFECSTIGMVYSIKHELIIIAFKDCVRFFLNVHHQHKLIEIQQNYKQFRYITHLVLSSNQKMIALGIQRNSDKANIIELYQVNLKQFKMKLHFQVDSAILFIDFNRLSNEKAFMLASTVNGLELFDLNVPENVNSELAVGIDWIGCGLIISGKVRSTKLTHEDRFKDGLIVNILEMGSDLILFDYYAGIYLYRNSSMIANCHLNISSIDSVAMSTSQRLLAVGSKVDRNIIILELPFDNPI